MSKEPESLPDDDRGERAAPIVAGDTANRILRVLAIASFVVMMLGVVVGITRLFLVALVALLVFVLLLYLRRDK
jgi:flagellar biosynthesis component FlhA